LNDNRSIAHKYTKINNIENTGMPIPRRLPATELYVINTRFLISSEKTPAIAKTMETQIKKLNSQIEIKRRNDGNNSRRCIARIPPRRRVNPPPPIAKIFSMIEVHPFFRVR